MATATVINTPSATPSQLESSIIITSGSTIRIRAPAKAVFDAILDTASYPLWNKFSPTLTFAPGESIRTVGAVGTLHCVMHGGRGETAYDVPVKITAVSDASAETRTLVWQGQMLPSWFGKAERVQSVTPIGENECELRQWESMSGWGVYLLKWVLRVQNSLDQGNVLFAEGLKDYVEGRTG